MSWKVNPTAPHGIICGSDAAQEWLLPWWWSRYTDHNTFPVTFCDFGMSKEAREWCERRGEVVKVEPIAVKLEREIEPNIREEWKRRYDTSLWQARSVWFCKPFALLHSPYQRGIWIDLDCEVLGPLEPVFAYCTSESQIGIMREFNGDHLERFDPLVAYNSGVIVFEHGVPLIEKWAAYSLSLNHRFMGDEDLLSHLICEMRVEVVELPRIYNWKHVCDVNPHAVVMHYTEKWGKEFIRNTGGMKADLGHLRSLIHRLPAQAS